MGASLTGPYCGAYGSRSAGPGFEILDLRSEIAVEANLFW